ncbi:ArsR family transcriptional regulator [Candidatus Pacearchaeota archaeon]|nr:ArsR family transcriptional regulator [Candidatus Pacearchaeota archaeon]
MELDSFLTESKWQILKIIAKNPSSPVIISKIIKTSVAYVSQQLKILEAANIVTKKRTGAVDKGKPRSVYSISQDFVYLTILTKENPTKKKLTPNNHQKVTLNIWAIDNSDIHYYLEKLYWKLESHIKNINGIYLDSNHDKPKVIILSNNKKINDITKTFLKENNKIIDIEIMQDSKSNKIENNFYTIFESSNNSKLNMVTNNES